MPFLSKAGATPEFKTSIQYSKPLLIPHQTEIKKVVGPHKRIVLINNPYKKKIPEHIPTHLSVILWVENLIVNLFFVCSFGTDDAIECRFFNHFNMKCRYFCNPYKTLLSLIRSFSAPSRPSAAPVLTYCLGPFPSTSSTVPFPISCLSPLQPQPTAAAGPFSHLPPPPLLITPG